MVFIIYVFVIFIIDVIVFIIVGVAHNYTLLFSGQWGSCNARFCL